MKKVLFLLATACLMAGCCRSTKDEPVVASEYPNATIETLMARRSIRAYKDKPVAHETMEWITLCGINAPNGMNAQPWEVRIVDNPTFIEQTTALFVTEMKKDERSAKMVEEPGFKNMYRNAPTVVFIATKEGNSLIDCGLLAGNMVNAAQSLGVGSVCLGGPVRFLNGPEAAPFVAQLGFSEGYKLVLAIGFGYPDESPEAKPRDLSKVKFVE